MVFTNKYSDANNIDNNKPLSRPPSVQGSKQNSVAGGNTPRNMVESDNGIPNQTMEIHEINEDHSSIPDAIVVPILQQNIETNNYYNGNTGNPGNNSNYIDEDEDGAM